jgi:hypothetical protein
MDITLTGDNLTVTIEETSTLRIVVRYTGVIQLDRRELSGWGLPLKHRKLAERLKRAIEAGVVYGRAAVATDVNGKTYLKSDWRVFGRTMNADLKRLGF